MTPKVKTSETLVRLLQEFNALKLYDLHPFHDSTPEIIAVRANVERLIGRAAVHESYKDPTP